ncbi:hypothetical protein C4588_05715, partial [Candidatus Parcubacteria bacterium]
NISGCCCCYSLLKQELKPKIGKVSLNEKGLKVTIDDLEDDYIVKGNEIKADEMYKGKILEIPGKITSVDKHKDDNFIEVDIESIEEHDVYASMEGKACDCAFSIDQENELSKLIRGQRVIIKGVFEDGYSGKHKFNLGLISHWVLYDCIITYTYPKNSEMKQLYTAIDDGDIDKVKSFISKDAIIDFYPPDLNTSLPPLHYAAWKGETEIVNFFISQGANVNAKNEGGYTPLDCASNEKIENIIKTHGGVPGSF